MGDSAGVTTQKVLHVTARAALSSLQEVMWPVGGLLGSISFKDEEDGSESDGGYIAVDGDDGGPSPSPPALPSPNKHGAGSQAKASKSARDQNAATSRIGLYEQREFSEASVQPLM